jgi:pimeloyl-ACP methyl ester carboxylesterase
MRKISSVRIIILICIIVAFIVFYFYNTISIKRAYKTPQQLAGSDSKFIEVDGINIHYVTYGSGDRVFVLIHGFGASTYSFKDVMKPLSAYGKVVAFDLPGFGLSERPNIRNFKINPYSREGQVEITKDFIDNLNLGRVILVGHSMGGTIASILAIEYPEVVDGLVLEDPAIYDGAEPSYIVRKIIDSMLVKAIFPIIARPLADNLQVFLKRAFYDQSKVTEAEIEGYKKSFEVENWDKGLYQILIANNRVKFIDKVGQIDVPVLVVTGADDKIVPPEDTEKFSKLLKYSRLVVINNCGHIPHEEDPQVFVHAVVNFIEEYPFL